MTQVQSVVAKARSSLFGSAEYVSPRVFGESGEQLARGERQPSSPALKLPHPARGPVSEQSSELAVFSAMSRTLQRSSYSPATLIL
jgi:hypothetical protein